MRKENYIKFKRSGLLALSLLLVFSIANCQVKDKVNNDTGDDVKVDPTGETGIPPGVGDILDPDFDAPHAGVWKITDENETERFAYIHFASATKAAMWNNDPGMNAYSIGSYSITDGVLVFAEDKMVSWDGSVEFSGITEPNIDECGYSRDALAIDGFAVEGGMITGTNPLDGQDTAGCQPRDSAISGTKVDSEAINKNLVFPNATPIVVTGDAGGNTALFGLLIDFANDGKMLGVGLANADSDGNFEIEIMLRDEFFNGAATMDAVVVIGADADGDFDPAPDGPPHTDAYGFTADFQNNEQNTITAGEQNDLTIFGGSLTDGDLVDLFNSEG